MVLQLSLGGIPVSLGVSVLCALSFSLNRAATALQAGCAGLCEAGINSELQLQDRALCLALLRGITLLPLPSLDHHRGPALPQHALFLPQHQPCRHQVSMSPQLAGCSFPADTSSTRVFISCKQMTRHSPGPAVQPLTRDTAVYIVFYFRWQ